MARDPSHITPVGKSPSFRLVLQRARRVATWLTVTVLLYGETGAGKDVVARYIHQQSNVAGPFLAINCGAFQDTVLEVELFGSEKGVYTDAKTERAGLVDAAADGTLFLDEVAEMSPAMQVKILRFLESQEYRRVGGLQNRKARCRILAATHQDLAKLVREGRFREDLYFRLVVHPITIPPLRERPEDITVLATALLQRVRVPRGMEPLRLDGAVVCWLEEQQWRGNVRELKAFIERSAVAADGGLITMSAVREALELVPLLQSAMPIESSPPVERVEASDDSPPSTREQILTVLAGGAEKKESEIVKACGSTRSAIRRPLAKLHEEGVVVKGADGRYRLGGESRG